MKVKVVRSFSAFVEDSMVCGTEGQVLELPEGADWIRAGLVVALEPETPARAGKRAPETAVVAPADNAVLPAGKKRKG